MECTLHRTPQSHISGENLWVLSKRSSTCDRENVAGGRHLPSFSGQESRDARRIRERFRVQEVLAKRWLAIISGRFKLVGLLRRYVSYPCPNGFPVSSRAGFWVQLGFREKRQFESQFVYEMELDYQLYGGVCGHLCNRRIG